MMFLVAKKAYLKGVLQDGEYAYVQLPPEAGGGVFREQAYLRGRPL